MEGLGLGCGNRRKGAGKALLGVFREAYSVEYGGGGHGVMVGVGSRKGKREGEGALFRLCQPSTLANTMFSSPSDR